MSIVMMNGKQYGSSKITASVVVYEDTSNIGATSVQQAINQTYAQVEINRKDIRDIKNNITSMSQQIATINNDIATINQNIAAVNTYFNNKFRDLTASQVAFTNGTGTYKNLGANVQSAITYTYNTLRYANGIAYNNSTLTSLGNTVQKAISDVYNFANDLTASQIYYNNTYENTPDKNTVQSAITTTYRLAKNNQTDITSMQSNITSMQSNITSMQSNITSMQSNISTLQTQLGSYKILKKTQTEYDALSKKDTNTIYLIPI